MKVKFVWLALITTSLIVFILPFNANVIAQSVPEIVPLANSDADTFLSALVIIALSLIILVFLGTSCFVAHTTVKNNSKAAEYLNAFFSSSNALQILTVSSVVVTLMFLALSDSLTEGALALLSSVAGYVLGSLQGSNRIPQNAIQKQPERQKEEENSL